jgi:hypothetical protein
MAIRTDNVTEWPVQSALGCSGKGRFLLNNSYELYVFDLKKVLSEVQRILKRERIFISFSVTGVDGLNEAKAFSVVHYGK